MKPEPLKGKRRGLPVLKKGGFCASKSFHSKNPTVPAVVFPGDWLEVLKKCLKNVQISPAVMFSLYIM